MAKEEKTIVDDINEQMEQHVKTEVDETPDGQKRIRSEGHDPKSNIPEALKRHVLDETKGDMVLIFSVNEDGVSVASLSKGEGVKHEYVANLAITLLQQAIYHKELLEKMGDD